jgi:hypothetical protein
MIIYLDSLINILEATYNNFSIYNFVDYVKSYKGDDWIKYIEKNQLPFYKKTIYKSKNFEVIIISWKKNYETEFHKHPKNGCVFTILSGRLSEIRLSNTNNEYGFSYGIFDTSYMSDDIGIHKIIAEEDTYSLHIYSPPGFYDKF